MQNNDYENLYNSLANDINNSMKKMDFEVMSLCLGKVKFANRGILYYEILKKSSYWNWIKWKVQVIIEKTIIPVTINFKLNDRELKIEKVNLLKKFLFWIFLKMIVIKKWHALLLNLLAKKSLILKLLWNLIIHNINY